MALSNRYKFILDIPNHGTHEAKPCNGSLQWCWIWDSDFCIYRFGIDTEIFFDKDTFDILKELERAGCECHRVAVLIQRDCNDGKGFQEYKEAWIPWQQGEWDYRKCTIKTEICIIDPLSCLFDDAKDDIDLFECIEERCEIKTIKGEVICTSVVGVIGYPLPPPGYGWTLTSRSFALSGGVPQFFATYCRDCSDVPFDGFVLENGKYYNFVGVGAPVVSDDGNITNWPVVDISSNNGISFNDMFEAFAKDCDFDICSNLFGINPDGTNPNNDVYFCAKNELWGLKVFQASDIIYANADDVEGGVNATIFNKNFFDFWTNWKDKFFGTLEMGFDPDNNCLRIEHITYWDNIYSSSDRPRLNLLADFRECLPMNYKYQKENKPKREIWSEEDIGNVDWDDFTVTYDTVCSNKDNRTNDRSKKIDCIRTNISYLYNNATLQENETTDGMVVVATDENGFIISGIGPISGEGVINQPMSTAALFYKYGIYNRPTYQGTVNGDLFPFKSIIHQRCESGIAIPMCCTDWDKFNPRELVLGFFGQGKMGDRICFEEDGSQNGLLSFDVCYRC